MEEEIKQYNKDRAKEIVDTMFEGKLFAEHITRDHMMIIEDLLAFEFQSKENSTYRAVKFLSSVKSL